eukprot:scaffold1410_cov154-Amphora_coffeaeformis.AAC.5
MGRNGLDKFQGFLCRCIQALAFPKFHHAIVTRGNDHAQGSSHVRDVCDGIGVHPRNVIMGPAAAEAAAMPLSSCDGGGLVVVDSSVLMRTAGPVAALSSSSSSPRRRLVPPPPGLLASLVILMSPLLLMMDDIYQACLCGQLGKTCVPPLNARQHPFWMTVVGISRTKTFYIPSKTNEAN